MPTLKLHDYQSKAVDFALLHKSTYQMLDMGMGKTAIALKWITKLPKDAKGTLVIAPLSTIYSSWPEETGLWTPDLKYTILHGKNKNDGLSDNSDLYLINFEGVTWLFEALKYHYSITNSVPFRSIVIDEGSMIKSHSTKRFRVLRAFIEVFPKYKMILSGTPAPNSLMDLWSQYYMLDQGKSLGKNITTFRSNYFYQVDRYGYVYQLKKGCAKTIYKAIEPQTYRLDAKDYLKLPGRINNTVKIQLSKSVLEKYKKLEDDFYLSLEDEETATAFSVPALAMKLRQFVQGALYCDVDPETPKTANRPYILIHNEKLKVLKSLIESSNGKGILCPVQFKFELELIKKVIPSLSAVTGATPMKDRPKIFQDWNKGKIPLLVCSPKSVSHGLNLQHGSHIIVWYGLTWSAEQYAQLNKRLDRQGQKHKVIIHHLVCAKTIDENIMGALNKKISNQQDLLDYLKKTRRRKCIED